MRGDLLWVYEGLTEYLGMVLSARSGLLSPADARNSWAEAAAWLQTRGGRDWRPLTDTAIAAQLGLGVKTVETHRAAIKRKLKLKTATELVHYAVRWVETEGTR
jgi:DNA-binding CsgD family transcriptional regulator